MKVVIEMRKSFQNRYLEQLYTYRYGLIRFSDTLLDAYFALVQKIVSTGWVVLIWFLFNPFSKFLAVRSLI